MHVYDTFLRDARVSYLVDGGQIVDLTGIE